MFGEKLRQLRTSAGMTQVRLAKEIGVSQGTVYFWEKGINEPTAVHIAAVAEFFGVSADELLGITPPRSAALRSEDESALLRVYRSLPAEKRRTAVALLEALRDG